MVIFFSSSRGRKESRMKKNQNLFCFFLSLSFCFLFLPRGVSVRFIFSSQLSFGSLNDAAAAAAAAVGLWVRRRLGGGERWMVEPCRRRGRAAAEAAGEPKCGKGAEEERLQRPLPPPPPRLSPLVSRGAAAAAAAAGAAAESRLRPSGSAAVVAAAVAVAPLPLLLLPPCLPLSSLSSSSSFPPLRRSVPVVLVEGPTPAPEARDARGPPETACGDAGGGGRCEAASLSRAGAVSRLPVGGDCGVKRPACVCV